MFLLVCKGNYSCDCIGINHPLTAKLEFSARAKVVDTFNKNEKPE